MKMATTAVTELQIQMALKQLALAGGKIHRVPNEPTLRRALMRTRSDIEVALSEGNAARQLPASGLAARMEP